MPKIYVRVTPRCDLNSRHRCATAFTKDWKELVDIDDATRAAFEEDPYLEVSETPTVLVEVAAAVQTASAEATDVINNPSENDGDLSQEQYSDQKGSGETAESTADASQEQSAATETAQSAEADRMTAIKTAIAQLDPNASANWLKDGRPSSDAIKDLAGFVVSAAERDQAWTDYNAERSAG